MSALIASAADTVSASGKNDPAGPYPNLAGTFRRATSVENPNARDRPPARMVPSSIWCIHLTSMRGEEVAAVAAVGEVEVSRSRSTPMGRSNSLVTY